MLKVGIIGSRSRDSGKDYKAVEAAFLKLSNYCSTGGRVHVVSGGCSKGGDRFAEIIAKKYQHSITIHYPRWNHEGKRAGFVRNKLIADDSDILIACVSSERKGGTEHTIELVEYARKRVILV